MNLLAAMVIGRVDAVDNAVMTTIDVDGLTIGRLADFIANARFAGSRT